MKQKLNENCMVFINYLVSQRSPLVQLDDDLAVLLSISTCTKLYKILNLDGLDEYKVSNLCHENQYGIEWDCIA